MPSRSIDSAIASGNAGTNSMSPERRTPSGTVTTT